MNSDHPESLRDLFSAASEMTVEERERFLDENYADRPELRRAVEQLLHADEEAQTNPIWRFPALDTEARRTAADHRAPLERLGAYRILNRIGAGGMGVVYLAESDYDGVSKQVAIKAMPYAFDDEMVRRFQRERRILASLEHPNIARMLDAGTTPEGVLYLVMEYVDGTPLTRHVSDRNLGQDARLNLFRTVCGAVAYAHRNLIVHRDLKPGNILVTPEGVPKLLDFGIARLLDEPGAEATRVNLITPGYASPEQLAGGAITTASDIYSLGVILFELLTGEKPDGRRRLEGDLDNVVSMALREEPERRYSSAADLAEDVRRVMERYPVRARPDTLGYRMRRFVSRRPVELAVTIALAAALGIAAAVAAEQYREAGRRFNDVRTIANSFLFDVYDSIGAFPGSTKTRMVIAQRAQQYLDVLARDRSSDPALRSELAAAYLRLGAILGAPDRPNLGDMDGALANYRKAAGLLEGLGAERPDDAAVLRELGEIYGLEGRIAIRQHLLKDALAAQEQAVRALVRVAALRATPGNALPSLINARISLALAHVEVGSEQIDLAQLIAGEGLAAQAKSDAAQLLAQNPSDESLLILSLRACETLAYLESSIARITDAGEYRLRSARHFQEELVFAQTLSSRNPEKHRRGLADALSDMSDGWLRIGEAGRAEAAARESLRLFGQIAAADPNNTEATLDVIWTQCKLGNALAAEGRRAEAVAQFESFLAREEQQHEVHKNRATLVEVLDTRNELAALFLAQGRREAAIAQYRVNIEALRGSSRPAEMLNLALDYGLLGDALAPKDRLQATVCYREAVVLWDKLRQAHQVPVRDAGKWDELQRNLRIPPP